jgi:hypothetical protein
VLFPADDAGLLRLAWMPERAILGQSGGGRVARYSESSVRSFFRSCLGSPFPRAVRLAPSKVAPGTSASVKSDGPTIALLKFASLKLAFRKEVDRRNTNLQLVVVTGIHCLADSLV